MNSVKHYLQLMAKKEKYRALPQEYLPAVLPEKIKAKTLIIVAAYKNLEGLKKLKKSMEEFKEEIAHDVIVVNNGNDREISKWTREQGLQGFSRQNRHQNHGAYNEAFLRYPDYETYLVLDHDTFFVRTEWLTDLLREAEQQDVGAVGNLYVQFRQFYHLGHRDLERSIRYYLALNKKLPYFFFSLDHLSDHATLYKREALQKGGLYCLFEPDDKMGSILSEVEMSVRIRKEQYRIKQVAKSIMRHEGWYIKEFRNEGNSENTGSG